MLISSFSLCLFGLQYSNRRNTGFEVKNISGEPSTILIPKLGKKENYRPVSFIHTYRCKTQ